MFLLDRRRQLAPRTSEEEALFIAQEYAKNKPILEAKLANSVNGGRAIRQIMLDKVAGELSQKFNVAKRSRKYVEQKLRDMKKEARKFVQIQQRQPYNERRDGLARVPSEAVRVMIKAMREELGSSNNINSTYPAGLIKNKEASPNNLFDATSTPTTPISKAPGHCASLTDLPFSGIFPASSNHFFDYKSELWQSKETGKLLDTPHMFHSAMAVASWYLLQQPQKWMGKQGELLDRCSSAHQSTSIGSADVEPISSTTGYKMRRPKKGGVCGAQTQVNSPMSCLRRELMLEKIRASRAFSSLCKQIQKSVEATQKGWAANCCLGAEVSNQKQSSAPEWQK